MFSEYRGQKGAIEIMLPYAGSNVKQQGGLITGALFKWELHQQPNVSGTNGGETTGYDWNEGPHDHFLLPWSATSLIVGHLLAMLSSKVRCSETV